MVSLEKWVKYMSISVANKHVKIFLILLVIREMEIIIIMRYHYKVITFTKM